MNVEKGECRFTPCVCVLRDDDEEDGEKAAARKNNTSVLSYFSNAKTDESARQAHRFFTERRLHSLDTL